MPICFDCLIDQMSDGRSERWNPSKIRALPSEQRFEALFEAARILIRDGVGEEDQVFPTLAFANGIGEGLVDLASSRDRLLAVQQDSELWEVETDRFIRACPKFRPVKVAEGVLILERLPISVKIRNYMHPEIVVPKMVTLEVSPGRSMTKPEHVAVLYEKVLSAAGIPCTEGAQGTISFEYIEHLGNRLLLNVKHSLAEMGAETLASLHLEGKLTFLHPLVVQRFYETLMGTPSGQGFARYLVGRSRGRGPDADTIVPACVAAYLRRYGRILSRKDVQCLLNAHVLSGTWKTLPEDSYGSSAVNQLWRDVEKVKAWTLHDSLALFC